MANGRDREFLRNLYRYAGESYTGDLAYGEAPEGNKWFEDFRSDVNNAFYTIDELKNWKEQAGLEDHAAALTEDEILTFVKYLANKLGNQSDKKRQARELLKGNRKDAPAGAQYKLVLLVALRVAFGTDRVIKAIETKLPLCAEADQIFGTDTEDLWELRHSSLKDMGYSDMTEDLLLGATIGELAYVRMATKAWDVLDVP